MQGRRAVCIVFILWHQRTKRRNNVFVRVDGMWAGYVYVHMTCSAAEKRGRTRRQDHFRNEV